MQESRHRGRKRRMTKIKRKGREEKWKGLLHFFFQKENVI